MSSNNLTQAEEELLEKTIYEIMGTTEAEAADMLKLHRALKTSKDVLEKAYPLFYTSFMYYIHKLSRRIDMLERRPK